MPARKSAKKKAAKRKAAKATKKKAAKAGSGKRAASKKKAAAGAKKSARKAAPAKKKAAARVARKKSAAPAEKPTQKPTVATPTPTPPPAAPKGPKGRFSAADVNLGHVFALRPRVTTSFRQEHFRNAKARLRDESYATIEEAARAVAETALEITHDGPIQYGGTRRKNR